MCNKKNTWRNNTVKTLCKFNINISINSIISRHFSKEFDDKTEDEHEEKKTTKYAKRWTYDLFVYMSFSNNVWHDTLNQEKQKYRRKK